MTMRRVKLLCTALMLLASHGALAVSYPLPPEGSRLVGSAFTIAVPDNNTQPLESFAAQYGQGLSNMLEANLWGRCLFAKLRLDADYSATADPEDTVREGIVINVAEMRLYYYPPLGNSVEVLPIGIGQAGRETPRNWVTAVERKQEGPTWVPTANTRREYAKEGKTLPAMVPPGPIIRWGCMRSTSAGSTPSTVPMPTLVSGCASARDASACAMTILNSCLITCRLGRGFS